MSLNTVYGLHAVKKMLQFSVEDCEQLLCLQNKNQRLQQIISLARQKDISIVYQSKDELGKLTETDKHQGCVLKVKEGHKIAVSLKELLQNVTAESLFLVLDGVQDPHNLGACLRTADAAGVVAVIVPKDRSAGIPPW